MILSASRRTDIVCYYSEWFMNRIREGYVFTRNPMNHAQISRIPLTPETVDCIVFWTKDAYPMMPYLDELDRRGYAYYFQHTLTPYGHDLERNLRPKPDIEKTFMRLSARLGRERVLWRYDPVLLNSKIDVQYHETQFRRMCDILANYTDTVTISFVDMYAKLRTPQVRAVTREEMEELAACIGACAREHGLKVTACCEKMDLSRFGITHASCIEQARIETIIGCPLDIRQDKNQRKGCGCYESIDIGAYNTCMNGCVYCYANYNESAVRRNWETHNPMGELLLGQIAAGECVRERKVKSNKMEQMSLF